LFLLNNSPRDFSRGNVSSQPSGIRGTTPGSHNELYRNNCNGTFTNVSKEAGILSDAGFGLGVAVADLNGDGWPDIYVSNDVAPNDVVYINNANGTSPTNPQNCSSTRTSRAWASKSPISTTTDGPTFCRSTCSPGN